MLKLVGLMGLVIGFGMIGILKAQNLKERIVLLEDFLKMELQVKSQINYFRKPITSIFNKIDENSPSKAFFLLNRVNLDLGEKRAEIDEIWASNTKEIYKDTPLRAEDVDTFNYLGTFIGQTDYDNQLFHFEYLENLLNAQIADARQSYKVKGPLFRKIGFFLGGIIALIFI